MSVSPLWEADHSTQILHPAIMTDELEQSRANEPALTNGHDVRPEKRHPILIIVMGVAGTGKSTLAQALDVRLDLPYIEGDELHPPANIDKMSAGIPLTDADREPWLARLRTTAERMVVQQEAGAGPTRRPGALVTCSALRRYYRDILRGAHTVPGHIDSMTPSMLPTYFVYIKGNLELLRERIAKRTGHYMKPSMLDSQLETLESPEGEENVVVVPLEDTTEEQVRKAIEGLKKLGAL
ncbi:putative gluconokinase [Grifola frondosa]|uniref:Gluconokinase n=1 Tax=Grifola frondosa TaxID=5627 RepID=A0A1C7M2C7_GRIFR|nr:putative gluconokinase [Grifola frondosa]